ncbi:hypothetical protein LINPERPRIM_LOCUS3263 [Linum perenne]
MRTINDNTKEKPPLLN